MASIWAKTVELSPFPILEKDAKTDVLIVGGGMAGVLCAFYLQRAGGDCLVVEDAVAGAEAGCAGGFAVACVGDATQEKAGDYNMDSIRQLLDVV